MWPLQGTDQKEVGKREDSGQGLCAWPLTVALVIILPGVASWGSGAGPGCVRWLTSLAEPWSLNSEPPSETDHQCAFLRKVSSSPAGLQAPWARDLLGGAGTLTPE